MTSFMWRTMIGAGLFLLLGSDGPFARAEETLPGELAPAAFRGKAAERVPKVLAVVGPFGKAEVNASFPSLALLYLRTADRLDAQSLLAKQAVRAYPGYRWETGVRPWATDSYTYVVGSDNQRYESRLVAPDKVAVTEAAGRRVVRIRGVKLSGDKDRKVVATEDWTVAVPSVRVVRPGSVLRLRRRDLSCWPPCFLAFLLHLTLVHPAKSNHVPSVLRS